ncbi:MAG TPA: c-type cytochrome [Caulobacteraceae bacterium]|jgi:cytochrome c
MTKLEARQYRVLALCITLLVPALGATGVQAANAPAEATGLHGDPVHGKALYQACSGCHSLDENDVGPKHRGVVGRHAGVVPGYAYSPALKGSGLVWTPANLDRWLTNPQALVPGARMFFSLRDPQSRADVIAYLGEQR